MRSAAEIRLRQQQRDQHDSDAEWFEHAKKAALHAVALTHEITGHVDDEQEFHRLDRLEAGYA